MSSISAKDWKSVWELLTSGIRDYVRKNGFTDVVLGLSGGMDSALVAALAVDALGKDHVHGVMMPSPWSSEGSITDSEALAANLGMETFTVPISPMMEAFEKALAPAFAGRERDVTEENIQSRIRGVIMMSFSNKFHWMLLATGNKSEVAAGYCTMYGDTCGGLAPIADLYKTEVYQLAQWFNHAEWQTDVKFTGQIANFNVERGVHHDVVRRGGDVGKFHLHLGTNVFHFQRIDGLPRVAVAFQRQLQHAVDNALFSMRKFATFHFSRKASIAAEQVINGDKYQTW